MRSRRFISIICIILSFLLLSACSNKAKLEGKNGDKLWISDIPGAEYVENFDYSVLGSNAKPISRTREEEVEYLRSQPLLVYGEAENINSFFIDYEYHLTNRYSWFITTFDIKIIREINGTFDTDILKCITRIRYIRENDKIQQQSTGYNLYTQLSYEPSGVFILEDMADEVWSINGKDYRVSDYADYYVGIKYECEVDGIVRYDGIKWEEIENN